MNIDIYMPRLDATFKRGPVPKERGPIPALRQYWKDFCLRLRDAHIEAGDRVRILEVPLWQITESIVLQTSKNAHKIYIPHKMKLNWYLDDRVLYYMQMVIPNIFSIDKDGWCASASSWPINAFSWSESPSTPDIYRSLINRVHNNVSKFNQPDLQDLRLPQKYVLFPCQLPHDETIQFHSDVSVENSLMALLSFIKDYPDFSIVVKGHPANMEAMYPLKTIFNQFKNNCSPEDGSRFVWLDQVSIHQLIANCTAVFTVNSGVGLESLLHGKRVFTFGYADYASASKKIVFGGSTINAVKAIANEIRQLDTFYEDKASQELLRSFINSWYYHHYDCEDIRTFKKL